MVIKTFFKTKKLLLYLSQREIIKCIFRYVVDGDSGRRISVAMNLKSLLTEDSWCMKASWFRTLLGQQR